MGLIQLGRPCGIGLVLEPAKERKAAAMAPSEGGSLVMVGIPTWGKRAGGRLSDKNMHMID